MAIDLWSKLGEVILPTKINTGGVANTTTYNAQQPSQAITAPDTNNHLRDLLSERISDDDTDLIEKLMIYDTDVSAAVSAYLTLANTEMRYYAKTPEGQIDPSATTLINELVAQLSYPVDYTLGFSKPRGIKSRNEALRYMLLKRGSVGLEMVIDKATNTISDARNIDTDSLKWYEKTNGSLAPTQDVNNVEIDLNIPTFYYASHRGDPSSPYSKSYFISVINTVYARLQVMNDLYDIMQITGYPRITVKLLEESITNTMKPEEKKDPIKRSKYVATFMSTVTSKMASIKPNQPLVYTDSMEVSTLNVSQGGGSTSGIDIRPIIEVLNAQNQAALKSVATVLGRGTSGVNTASVESQIFSMQAAELNEPLAEVWSQFFTFALRLSGSTSYVVVYFDKPEMRPPNELEPANVQKQARLQKDLSLGLITDDEYHQQMYNRPRPSTAPILSGTGFYNESANSSTDTSSTANATTNTPQSDQPNSVQRTQTKTSDASAKSNTVK